MIKSEADKLCKNVVPFLGARVPIGHSSGHHLEGDPAEPPPHSHADIAGIHLLEPPSCGQGSEVLVAPNQIVGDDEDRTPQVVVGASHQGTVWAIDLVALIPRREQAGSPGNGSGLDVMLDRPHLAREFGRRDDVNSGNA